MNTDIKDLFKNVKVKDPIILWAIVSFVVVLVLTIIVVPSFIRSVQRNQELVAENDAASQALEDIVSIQSAQPESLRQRIAQAKEQLAALLVNFPSTSAAAQELSAYYGYANSLDAQLVRMEAMLNTPEEDAATAFKVQRFLLEVRGEVPSIMRFWAQIGSGPFKTFLLDNLVISAETTPVGQADLTVYSSDLVLELQELMATPQLEESPTPAAEVTPTPTEMLAPTPSPAQSPVTAAPSPTIQSTSTIYRVRPGDSLAKIAAKYGLSVDELMQVNKLDSESIYIDQRLVIPSN